MERHTELQFLSLRCVKKKARGENHTLIVLGEGCACASEDALQESSWHPYCHPAAVAIGVQCAAPRSAPEEASATVFTAEQAAVGLAIPRGEPFMFQFLHVNLIFQIS